MNTVDSRETKGYEYFENNNKKITTNDQINQIKVMQSDISEDEARKFCEIIQKQRENLFKEAKKLNASKYIKASEFGTARSWQVTPTNQVIIYFNKAKRKDKTIYKDRFIIKKALNFDTLVSYASYSGLMEKLEVQMEGFKLVKGIPGFAQMDNDVTYNKNEDTKLRFTVTLGDQGNLESLFKKIVSDKKLLIKTIHQMVNAVTRLHAFGLLHRDLKFTNMVISSAFGLLIIDPETVCFQYTGHSMMRTTAWYASPEILEKSLKNNSVEYTTKLDIWSLGCALYSLYFNKLRMPWQIYLSVKKILEKINSEFAKNWFSEPLNKDSFDHLIWEMLQKDPKKRPEMVEIQRRLQKCLPYEE